MITLHNRDCLQVMSEIESGSVDLILTDPPYYSTALHFDKAPRIDYGAWLLECKRVLKPHGVLVSFCDLNLLIELRGHKVFKTAYELIWQKNTAVGQLDANRRPLRNHEFLLVMVNGLNRAVYNPQKTKGSPTSRDPVKPSSSYIYAKLKGCHYINESGDRHPCMIKTTQNQSNNLKE